MKKIIILSVLFSAFTIISKAQYMTGKLSTTIILPEQTVSVILTSNETINAALKESIKLYWTKCKYEFVTYDEIADSKKIGDYYITVINPGGFNGSGYSTTAAYTAFGISKKDISSKACKEYKKSKSEFGFICTLTLFSLVSTFLDPCSVDANIAKGTTQEPFFHKALNNAIILNIKTINWFLTTDLEKYFKKGRGSGDMAGAIGKYNSNSCELSKMTLLVSTTDTITRREPDYLGKNFDINKFKEYYKFDIQIASPEKIKEYLSTDTKNKYALLVQGVYSRSPVVLVYRLTDGAILFGSFIANSSSPGYNARAYKQFDDVCK